MKLHRIPVGAFATNCVLLEDETSGEALVIDPGGDGETIARRIEAHGVRPIMIIHTHGHMDHCMESSALARRFRVPIAMHAADLPLYRQLALQVEALLGPQAAQGMKGLDVVEPQILLADGDKVRAGAIEATVMHLPGHSPGGIGLLLAGTPGILVCGDTIFRDGVGRTDLWGGDWDVLLRSIRERIFTLPADTRLVTGHGAETTVARESGNFPY